MFETVSAIKALNARNGNHFFDRATMRFFSSKVLPYVYGGRLFLTSEQFTSSTWQCHPRRFTVRLARNNGEIETIGPFNELSKEQAQTLAKLLAPIANELAANFDKESENYA